MLNKNERMEKLNAMGVNTGKFFTVNLENGTKVHLIIDENGNPTKVDDVIANSIIEDIIIARIDDAVNPHTPT